MLSGVVSSIFQRMVGGSTQPLLINAIDDNGLDKEYVLKLYKTSYERISYPTFKEFIVNYLVGEFELNTPEALAVHLPEEIIRRDRERIPQFNNDNFNSYELFNCKFALEYIEATIVGYNSEFDFDISEYASIYAFDFLILNNDRGGVNQKSNLLVKDDGFVLIDHELTLSFIDNSNNQDVNLDVDSFDQHTEESNLLAFEGLKASILAGEARYNYRAHIFYEKLSSHLDKKGIFDEFIYFLESFSTNRLERYIKDLKLLDIECINSFLLVDYIRFLQVNIDKFHNILKESIS